MPKITTAEIKKATELAKRHSFASAKIVPTISSNFYISSQQRQELKKYVHLAIARHDGELLAICPSFCDFNIALAALLNNSAIPENCQPDYFYNQSYKTAAQFWATSLDCRCL